MTITRMIAGFRSTTPMFLAGGSPDDVALRVPSYKGVLRFWFRALAWSEYGGDLGAVKAAEDALFGSARTGQSRVLVSIKETEKEIRTLPKGSLRSSSTAYLLGLGLSKVIDKKPRTTRAALGQGTSFEVCHLVRRRSEKELVSEVDLLRRAIIVLGLLGGMGARSRRGFGSLTLETLDRDGTEIWLAPTTLTEIVAEMRRAIAHAPPAKGEPPFTAFSGASRIVVLPGAPGETSEALLERMGRALLHFRSYGRPSAGGRRQAAGASALMKFANDHHEMLLVAQGGATGQVHAPARVVFGLPHNYYFGSEKATVEVNASSHTRRASPLFLHVHAPEQGSPIGVVSVMPSEFLPNMSLTIQRTKPSSPKRHTATLRTGLQLWDPIREFLRELRDPSTLLCEKFPGAYEVKL